MPPENNSRFAPHSDALQELIRSRAIIADEMNRIKKLEQLVAKSRGGDGVASSANTSLGLENIIQA
jgi:hypothetical protein